MMSLERIADLTLGRVMKKWALGVVGPVLVAVAVFFLRMNTRRRLTAADLAALVQTGRDLAAQVDLRPLLRTILEKACALSWQRRWRKRAKHCGRSTSGMGISRRDPPSIGADPSVSRSIEQRLT